MWHGDVEVEWCGQCEVVVVFKPLLSHLELFFSVGEECPLQFINYGCRLIRSLTDIFGGAFN